MNSIKVIKKFIESNWIIERTVREVLERLPLRFRYGISYGPIFRYWLGFLKESEKWDRNKLEEFQVELLRDVLIHAEKNVPYYRKIFREYGFKPEKLQSLDEIKVVPYLTKTEVRKNLKDLVAVNITKTAIITSYTSGSTGEPLIIFGNKETEEKHWATIIDLWSRIGYGPTSRTIIFEANIRKGDRDGLPWKRYGNKLILSSNYFIDEWLDKYIEAINRFRPEYLLGFPQTIATFCSYIKNRGKSVFDGLKGIIVYAENLYTWQRELIGEVFVTRVFSDYGMVEKMIHGGECEHSQVCHIYPQYGFTEYIDIGNSLYELVGTGFINYVMPLIRYKTSDICHAKERKRCESCGRNYDMVEKIEGREGDFLITSDGDIVSVDFNFDFEKMKNIKEFQFYQEKPGEVEIRIVRGDNYEVNDANIFLSEVKRFTGMLGQKIHFKVTTSDKLSPQRGFKKRMIEQKLNVRDFQGS